MFVSARFILPLHIRRYIEETGRKKPAPNDVFEEYNEASKLWTRFDATANRSCRSAVPVPNEARPFVCGGPIVNISYSSPIAKNTLRAPAKMRAIRIPSCCIARS